MVSVAELTLLISGKDQASQTLKSVGDSTDGLSSKIGSLSKVAGVAALGVGALGIGAATGLLKLGADFDSAYDKIQTATGATGDQLDGLKQVFKDTFTAVPTDMESASTAIATLASKTGATGETLGGLSQNVLELSRITGTDLNTNIGVTADLMNNWGLSAEDTLDAQDKLFAASQKTGVAFGEIADSVTKNASTFREMGISVDDATALIAGLEQSGVDADAAMGGLTKAVGKFAKDGKDAGTAIQSTFDAIKDAKSPTDAIAIAVDTFGAKAGPKLADSIRTGKFAVDDLKKAMASSQDSIYNTAQSTADFGEKLTLLKNKAIVALEPLANQVFALANAFIDDAVPALERFGNFMSDVVVPAIVSFTTSEIVPVVQAVALAMADLATTVADKLQGPITTVFEYFKNNQTALEALGVAIGTVLVVAFTAWAVAAGLAAVATIAAAAPVIALGLVIGGLAAGIYLLITHWDDITAKFPILGTVADGVKTAVQVFVDWITTTFIPAVQAIYDKTSTVVSAVVTFVQQHWHEVWDAISPVVNTILLGIQTLWSQIQTTFETAIGIIEGVVDIFMGIFTGDWDRVKEGIMEIVGALWTEVEGTFDNFKTFLYGLYDTWWGIAKDLGGRLKDGLVSGIEGIADKVWEKVEAAANKVIDLVNGIIGAFNTIQVHIPGVHLPDWMGGGGFDGYDFGVNIPTVPYLAQGALVRKATLAMIGEDGPELVLPLNNINRIDDLIGDATTAGLIPAAMMNDGWWNLPGAAAAVAGWNIAPPQFASGGFGGIAGAMDPSQWNGGGGGPVYMWGDPNQTTVLGQGANGRRSRGGDTHIHVHVPEGGVVTDMDGFVQKLRREFDRAVA